MQRHINAECLSKKSVNGIMHCCEALLGITVLGPFGIHLPPELEHTEKIQVFKNKRKLLRFETSCGMPQPLRKTIGTNAGKLPWFGP